MKFLIKEHLNIQKYLQIVNEVSDNISNGNLKIGEKMLSINKFSKEYNVSRDTVEKAYIILKKKRLIIGIKGKGYYVNNMKFTSKIKILFFSNKPNHYTSMVYKYFTQSLGNDYQTNLLIYDSNETIILDLLKQSINKYDYYMIMPDFSSKNNEKCYYSIDSQILLKGIPKDKLIVFGNNKLKINSIGNEDFQHFDEDFYYALKTINFKVSKYKKLKLIAPIENDSLYFAKAFSSFKKYCDEHSLKFSIFPKISKNTKIDYGDLFVIIEDCDLVKFMEIIKGNNYIIGKDIGIISYIETPLKRLLDIAVISPDFKIMGETAAKMVSKNDRGNINSHCSFIDRNSI